LRTEQLAAQLGESVTFDQIVGPWHVYQLKKGHRFSTDDLLVAWAAIQARPAATRLLDIGAGIGSVGLMTLYAMPDDAHLTQVEVQRVSHTLARATVEDNGLTERIESIHLDLRDHQPSGPRFELVTGSPPYFPTDKAVTSPHPQRAGARMELRGDVFDYCRAAARAMAPGGAFCFCHAAGDARPEVAIRDAGLVLVCRQEVVFREGLAPTISLFTCEWSGERADAAPLVVRRQDGKWTEQYAALRKKMTTRS
jgi:tRNA1Val (adenine37-N6)-methyltransferase